MAIRKENPKVSAVLIHVMYHRNANNFCIVSFEYSQLKIEKQIAVHDLNNFSNCKVIP